VGETNKEQKAKNEPIEHTYFQEEPVRKEVSKQ